MIRINLYIPQRQHASLKALANSIGGSESMSSLIRRSIDNELHRQKKSKLQTTGAK